jgi:hypothetical protein
MRRLAMLLRGVADRLDSTHRTIPWPRGEWTYYTLWWSRKKP